jgi:hypothetical protein
MIAPEHQPCFASLVKSFCHRHDGLWAAGRLASPNANHMKKADQAPWSVAQKIKKMSTARHNGALCNRRLRQPLINS